MKGAFRIYYLFCAQNLNNEGFDQTRLQIEFFFPVLTVRVRIRDRKTWKAFIIMILVSHSKHLLTYEIN